MTIEDQTQNTPPVNQRAELDIDINQQVDSEPLLNPIKSEQQDFETQPNLPVKPTKKDKKTILLLGLSIFLIILLTLSTLVSTIARSRLPKESSLPDTSPTQPVLPPINNIDLTENWKQKLAPVKSNLKTLQENLIQNEFLPPALDKELGI